MAKSRGRTSSGTTSSSTTTHSPSSNHTSSGQQTAAPDKNSVGSGVGSGMNGKKKAAAGAAAVTGAAYALDAGAVGDMANWFGHALGDLGGDFFGGAMEGAGLGGMNTVLFVAGGVVILYIVMR